MILRGIALGVGCAALWFAYQLGMEWFLVWYSGTEYENGTPPWGLLVAEIAVFAAAGIAAVVFALWRRRDPEAADADSG